MGSYIVVGLAVGQQCSTQKIGRRFEWSGLQPPQKFISFNRGDSFIDRFLASAMSHSIEVLQFADALAALKTRSDDDGIFVESETVSLTDCL